jgi:hypothetical protein
MKAGIETAVGCFNVGYTPSVLMQGMKETTAVVSLTPQAQNLQWTKELNKLSTGINIVVVYEFAPLETRAPVGDASLKGPCHMSETSSMDMAKPRMKF